VGDVFEEKRIRLGDTIKALSIAGTPIRNPEFQYREIDRSEAELGRGIEVSILTDEGASITGHILSKSIRLSAFSTLPETVVDRLDKYLHSLNMGRVRITKRD
ncbi:MAG TPA: hypothetical protein VGL71_08570, partial [Urbifossiella sp.]|jgi:hypothetical protein